MGSNYLKPFGLRVLDLAFLAKSNNFIPLFDGAGADRNPIINWDGTGTVYDIDGNQLDTTGLTPAEAIARYGISFPTYTSSSGLRAVDGAYNNLFNGSWGNTDLPFLQRTQVVFDNYVKPLAADDPDAFYGKLFATSADPATADYTKLGDNLSTPDIDESQSVQNVIDYTPRMISRTVTTAGATFVTEGPESTHLTKDAYGFTAVQSYGLLETLGQQDIQKSIKVSFQGGGFVTEAADGTFIDIGSPDAVGAPNAEYFIGATNPGVSPVNGWFVLFGQFFDHGLDFVGKGADGTKITINLAPTDPMYGVIDPTSGMPATKIVISRADVSGFTADGTPQWVNHTSPYIDQSQTYGSHAQLTSLLREWVMDPATGTYRPGMNLLDGQTSRAWVNGFGETTTATLPTLNELRQHLIATGREDLSWEDVINLRNRDASGNVIDSDPNAAGVQASGSGAALLLDMNPRFDAAHFLDPLNPDAAAAFQNNVAVLAATAQAMGPGFDFGFNGDTIYLDVPADIMGPGAPATPLTGASALYFWVNFGDFSIKNAMALGPTIVPVSDEVHDAVSDLMMAAVGDHYIAGDGRVNENIGLTAVHHVFHEEHNYQVQNVINSIIGLDAREVALDQNGTYQHEILHEWQIATGTADAAGNYLNADGSVAWDQDKLFNAAKMIVEMEYQHTAVDQFARTITPNLHEFVGYNSGENATISLDFAQVAYRFGHSTLRESIDMIDPDGTITGGVMRLALEQAFLTPAAFAAAGAGSIALGMTHQQANEIDEFLTPALNQGLLGQPLDLAAINIARGRDLGVPTLNDMREALQLTRYTSWADFGANMIHPDNLVNFIAAYSFDGNVARAAAIISLANDEILEGSAEAMGYTVQQAVDFLNNTDATLHGVDGFEHIDAWLGGLAEVHVTGGLLGETFDTIFVDQIGRLMDGDRFYYLQRLNNIPYGQEIIDEQFKDIIERTTGVEHLNGSAFAYADQYYDLAQQAVSNARTEHAYAAQLAANPGMGVYSDGGTTTSLNGGVVTMNGVQYIRDIRTPSADTKAGNPAGFQLDGAPNSGVEAHEVIVGSDFSDLLYARGGDDTVYGDDGNDFIYGGNGIDRLYGGAGNDMVFGGDGADLIDGGAGDDALFGEQSATAAAGVDQVIGGAGNDYVDGGIGIDKLSGSEGDDVIFGGGDTDAFTHGGEGNDYIDGGVTGDLLWGDNGDDYIVGQADQDIVAGMEGDDILRPGPVSQSLTGGGDEVIGGDGFTDAGTDGKGVGFDLLDLSDWQAAPKGATFDLVNQNNPLPAIDGAPQFPAVAQMEGVIGTRNDDNFLGDANGNWLIGGSGNDRLTGGLGNDLIIGDGIRLDTLIGTYNSGYDLYFDGASHRAFGYADAAETTGLQRNFLQTNGLLDTLGWGGQKHFTEMLKSKMFKDLELGGNQVKDIWRNGEQQFTGESHGTMGDGGVTGTSDIAVFAGNFADYTIESRFFDLTTRGLVSSAGMNTIEVYRVTDTVAGRDGQDLLVGVEKIQFADRIVDFSARPAVDLHAFNNGNARDQFGSSSYVNSNGSMPWATNWAETNDRTGGNVVTGGEIRIASGTLEFGRDTSTPANPLGASIARGIDLSQVGSGTATLSLSWTQNRQNRLEAGEKVDVEFSADGVTWTTLETLGNGATTNSGTVTAALTGPFTANAAVQLVFSGVTDTSGTQREYVRIDNVDISFRSPVSDGNDWQATFTENGAPVALSMNAGVSGSETYASATILLKDPVAGDSLATTGIATTGNNRSYDVMTTTLAGGAIQMVITGRAGATMTGAQVQAAIDAVRFSNGTESPTDADRHVEVTVNNGVIDSSPALATVHVVSVDDPMVANNDSIVTNFAANTAFSVKVADLLANDSDLDNPVAITAVTTTSGLTASYAAGATTVEVTDNATSGGSFTYRGTGTDTATVSLTRDNSGALTGTNNADIVIANDASSTIDGDGGRDRIYGGGGTDLFDYNATTDAGAIGTVRSANIDELEVIMDWMAGERIDLSGIDARTGSGNLGDQAFAFLGDAAFTSGNQNGGLHVFQIQNDAQQWYTVIEASTDNDSAAEFQLALLGQHDLTGSDFFL